jgi:hypothetical protein
MLVTISLAAKLFIDQSVMPHRGEHAKTAKTQTCRLGEPGGGEIYLLRQRPVSVCCRAEVIIAYAPNTLFPCEMHESIVEKYIARQPFGSADIKRPNANNTNAEIIYSKMHMNIVLNVVQMFT